MGTREKEVIVRTCHYKNILKEKKKRGQEKGVIVRTCPSEREETETRERSYCEDMSLRERRNGDTRKKSLRGHVPITKITLNTYNLRKETCP